MEIKDIKDLMAQFDDSSLKEFTYQTKEEAISFSKNEVKIENQKREFEVPQSPSKQLSEKSETELTFDSSRSNLSEEESTSAEGQVVNSPLVGVAYLSSAPEKDNFVTVGDQVKKGQTLLIIEAMKVMNEVPAPCDGIVTEILVNNEDLVEFGKGLVRIK
ncbi:acetyl-CoA carboxylase biotin carboxyl carrier protein [Streptococcus parauberis]|uniref:Biotin carboxyl carrier protein of acetyl-CoA carboxylase n=2 Tax=Streptococcus parauberis TaxID=1348 RepID=F1Z300_9STRE|nr:acetyl-CoA carboxylase biotin carboxyl carrier protein [Streptococcus parauberis]AEF24658.1 acetyl-CoA carboxylase biotin carboxyl carrier protein subunit [Streptococcus parauberis KCTC 11537]AUT06749.1 Biotin carboxyl carrier protein of acetyl-CoA carboxylase [Streptococcus parauberis]EGE53718.1 acetyl-CoA carboxylase biotin carboxyl carrier protein subunit [Streptococcus parauberis NCFD 2020]EMG25336.1 Biotin carboxyl carrier protein of acetyl-CoA carboxylase [Streptococcus parauberis KRS-